jgi:hypothetical protein
MLYLVKRHPIPIEAHFDFTLVLTYALPSQVLEPLLAPGLVLDTFGEFGFLAIAMVKTEGLRPKGFPAWLGQDFFLIGYRIFSRFKTRTGQSLRGLRILRSDTDKAIMSTFGNLFTHYKYEHSKIAFERNDNKLHVVVETAGNLADLDVTVDLNSALESSSSELSRDQTNPTSSDSADLTATDLASSDNSLLPSSSPFQSAREARRFQGPLPFTFDYETQTDSIIIVEGVRSGWEPKLVLAEVANVGFLKSERFRHAHPRLASAFYMEDIPYWWKKGICEKISRE